MSAGGAALAAAAEALVGTPFRLHGRDEWGLDCVGLVIAALKATGCEPEALADYQLRQRDIRPWLGCIAQLGLQVATGPIAPGDVLLVRPGAAQHHLLVASRSGGFVHAHAGLRRVVHSPAPLTWPVLRHWRPMD